MFYIKTKKKPISSPLFISLYCLYKPYTIMGVVICVDHQPSAITMKNSILLLQICTHSYRHHPMDRDDAPRAVLAVLEMFVVTVGLEPWVRQGLLGRVPVLDAVR